MIVDLLSHDRAQPEATALIDAGTGEVWTYELLRAAVEDLAQELAGQKGVALVLVQRSVPSLVTYLAAFRAGHAVLPIEGDLDPSLLQGLIDTYRPELIIRGDAPPASAAGLNVVEYAELLSSAGSPSVLQRQTPASGPDIHPDVALLLSTSGSTGSPKLVRLTAGNVLSNADAIREALRIDENERAITSLAFSYSYGLSVIHSHLLAGASIVVSDKSVLMRDFWDHLREHEATSFAGVPYTYELIRRVGFAKMTLPSLRTLTQAGGKLGPDLTLFYHEIMASRGGAFIPMYGQTEATARISVLPPELLPAKLGSVGFPLPGGTLRIRPLDGSDRELDPGEEGELIYNGPNVMMGYAQSREDLAGGDELGGELVTGDSGYLDSDGCIFITGRLKRFAKLYGLRVSLDDVEGHLQCAGSVAALDGGDNKLVIYCVPASEPQVIEALGELSRTMQVNPRSFTVRSVESLPLLANGKIDYRTLGKMLAG
jgi:acyl-CoA synthetase (AMP-forming)/AMP-acid ligase II